MNDQWQALIYILSLESEIETPLHPLGPTQDDVRENLRIFSDRDVPCKVRQEGQQAYTELPNKAAVDRFLQEQLTIERVHEAP